MKAGIRSEAIKLISVRSTWLMLVAAAVFGLLAGTVLSSPIAEGEWIAMPHHPFLSLFTLLLGVGAFILGVRVVTDEFRFGTITTSALIEPRRWRLIAAKASVAPAAGAALAATAAAAAALFVAWWADANPDKMTFVAGDALSVIGWLALAGATLAIVGVGVGAAARHQLPTVVGGLVWFVVFEGVLTGVTPELSPYLPGRSAEVLVGGGPAAWAQGRVEAGLMLALYGVVTLIAGIAWMRRRDLA